jgi:hypothetical protein
MTAVHREYSAVVGAPPPIVTYRNDDELFHWDGCLFAFLCVATWVLFAYLWARLHWMNYLERRQSQQQRPTPLKSEQWLRPHDWRN